MSPKTISYLLASAVLLPAFMVAIAVYDVVIEPLGTWAEVAYTLALLAPIPVLGEVRHVIWRRLDWDSWAASNPVEAKSFLYREEERGRPITRVIPERPQAEPADAAPGRALLRAALQGRNMDRTWQGAVYFGWMFLCWTLFCVVLGPILRLAYLWVEYALRLLVRS